MQGILRGLVAVLTVSVAAGPAGPGLRAGTGHQDTLATVTRADGTTVVGVIAGRIALGDRPNTVALVHGRDIERIDEDGVRIRAGADVLSGSVSRISGADRQRYLPSEALTSPRLPLLERLVANEPPLEALPGAMADTRGIPVPERSQMLIRRAVTDRPVTMTGRDAVVVGELRAEGGQPALVEALSVETSAGVVTVPVSEIVPPRPRVQAGDRWRAEAMTADEARDAFSFAGRFTTRMQQTRDVASLLDELFVDGFADHLDDVLAAEDTAGVIVNLQGFNLFRIPLDVQRQLGRERLLESFVRTANFWYLTFLHAFSTLPGGRGPGADTLQDMLPPDAAGVLAANDSLRMLLDKPVRLITTDSPPESSGKGLVRDPARLEGILAALERFAAVMRPQVSSAEASESYQRFEASFDQARAASGGRSSLLSRATICGAGCGRLPPGTRFLEVTAMPYWHLHLLRTPDGLRIYAIDLPTD